MATITFALARRRTGTAQGTTPRWEFFFFPASDVQVVQTRTPIAPMLPGNTGQMLTGTNSAINFGLDIGTEQTVIRVNGAFVQTPEPAGTSALYPTLSSPDVHVPSVNESSATPTGTQTVTVAQVSGALLRSRFLDFVMDQQGPRASGDAFDSFCLVYPGWGANSNGSSTADVTILTKADGTINTAPSGTVTASRQWFGLVRNVNSVAEEAGLQDAFAYSFEFVVCAT